MSNGLELATAGQTAIVAEQAENWADGCVCSPKIDSYTFTEQIGLCPLKGDSCYSRTDM